MSATEVRMIPKHAQTEHDLAPVKGSQADSINVDVEVRSESIDNGFPERVRAKIDSQESADVELEAITVDLTSGIAPGETVVPNGTGFEASPTADDGHKHQKSSMAKVKPEHQPKASSPTSTETPKPDSKPKAKKVRTVQFAEGTTLPIVDVTPAPDKKAKVDPLVKGPVQTLTDTMQVLKRYENEARGAQVKIHQWEQKRIMLTIEGMWKSVIYTQCAVMLGMLCVILAMVLRQ